MKMNVAYSVNSYSLAEKGKNISQNFPNFKNFISMFNWLTTLLDEEFVFSFSITEEEFVSEWIKAIFNNATERKKFAENLKVCIAHPVRLTLLTRCPSIHSSKQY